MGGLRADCLECYGGQLAGAACGQQGATPGVQAGPLCLPQLTIPRPSRPQVERHWASFWHEAELMSRLNHPNVLRFFGLVVEGPMVVGIMTEFAAAGSLASYLHSGVGFIPLRQRAQLALHAVNGMAYLHSLKVRRCSHGGPRRWMHPGWWGTGHGRMGLN